jgi:signal transduction histidine kinase
MYAGHGPDATPRLSRAIGEHLGVRVRFAHLPLRVRLTLVFTGVMALVLAAGGFAIYALFAADLDRTLEDGLRARAGDAAALLRRGATGALQESGEPFAQVLGARGAVLDTTTRVGGTPLLNRAEVAEALRGEHLTERGRVPGTPAPVRLLARPARAAGQPVVVVIGESLEQRDDALDSLAALLLVAGPLGLVLTGLAGYLVTAAALRPVERMRARAAAITATEGGGRLPVPAGDDELARLGRTLNEMLARLEAAFARERTFVSDASHELRTPLAILRTELELALRRGRSAEELEAAVRSAAEETDRLSQLAEDLLVIARSDQGQLPIRRARVNADDVLSAVARRFGVRAHADGRTVDVEPAADVWLEADEARLEQALGNMVDNALRYGAGPVTLAARAFDGTVELHVRDAGIGFPPRFLPSAFERFASADVGGSRAGAGLGMAIISAIAGAHGGSAHAANDPGGGADVWLTLPG